ncbi:MAG: citramalate synthase [Clostridia bacterium]|nr:citramalate synthase [Clostridia bacterium]
MFEDVSKYNITKVIDRTLPEILTEKRKLSRMDIIDLCWKLKNIGADLIEINRDILKILGKLPKGITFLFRIECDEDLQLLKNTDISYCISKEEAFFNKNVLENNRLKALNRFIEIKADSISELLSVIETKGTGWGGQIDCLRITGLNNFLCEDWINAVGQVSKSLNVKIDICPDNHFYTATALALEAIKNQSDYVTVSFAGFGGEYGFAALEEVMVGMRVLLKKDKEAKLELLPDFSKDFTQLTEICIPGYKPLIGEDIFKYESGIHADGIEKEPSTYEPFEPEMIGQKRKLYIGKHSGRKSIEKKLQELSIDTGKYDIERILKKVRRKSMGLRRALLDEELKEICKFSVMAYS